MGLLNAALAFGAFAFTIPLVIHLFFRSRFKTLDWGAMHLLSSVMRVNRRRLQITNWLLLLLRCLIPVLLAFCLARPVWNSWKALAGDAPKTLIIAIDDSRSMAATPPGEAPRIEFAKQEIRTLLDELTRQDEVILVRSSRLGSIPGKMGVSEAIAALRRIDAKGSTVSAARLLDAAVSAAEESTHARRHVILVSDFQSQIVDSAAVDLAEQLRQSGRLDLGDVGNDQTETATGITIDLLDVSATWEDVSNVSVDGVETQSPVVVSGRSGVYSATLRNASELPANDLRLVWSIDGKPLEPRVVSIDAKSTTTNRLTHTIDQAGMHTIAVSLSRGDVLTNDNRRAVVVDVIDEIDVLLVDGRPSNRPLQGQSDYLAIALSPFAFGGDDRPDPVRASVTSLRQFSKKFRDAKPRVLILAGVGKLSATVKAEIADFVRGGGALVVFDGPDVESASYNEDWLPGPSEFVLPAVLGEVASAASGGSDSHFSVDQPTSLYTPWKILAPSDENPFADVKLIKYRRLERRSNGAISLLSTTGANQEGTAGDPIAVMQSIGDGTVVQFAIPGTNAWSNLPLRGTFLPMVQQLVLDLAGRSDDLVFDVGQPIVIEEDDWPEFASDGQDNQRVDYLLTTPTEESPIVSPLDDQPIRLTNTYEPGLYRISKRREESPPQRGVESVSIVRLASVDPSESMFRPAGAATIERFGEAIGAPVFRAAEELRSADRSRSYGQEMWRWLWVALLVALVLELWLQQNLIARPASVGKLP